MHTAAAPRRRTRQGAERASRCASPEHESRAARARPRRPPHADGLLLAGFAFDRRLRPASDLDAARLRLLRLRHANLEDAVAVLGVDRVLGNALRQADRAREGSVPALEAEEAVARMLARLLPLGGHGQGAVLDL